MQNSFTSADVKLDVLKKAKFKKKKKAFKTRDMTNEGSGKKIKPKKESTRIISSSLRYPASAAQHSLQTVTEQL